MNRAFTAVSPTASDMKANATQSRRDSDPASRGTATGGGAVACDVDVRSTTIVLNGHELRLSYYDDTGPLRERWLRLEDEAACSVFQSFEWVTAWYRSAAAPRGETPLIVVGTITGLDGRDASFIWPMAMVRRRGALLLEWAAQDYSGYKLGLFSKDAQAFVDHRYVLDVLDRVVRDHPRLNGILLKDQPAGWVGERNPFVGERSVATGDRSFQLLLSEDFDRIYESALGKKTRSTLRRKEKKLHDAGKTEIDVTVEPRDASDYYEAFKDQKAKQFKRSGKDNYMDHPGMDEFQRDILRSKHLEFAAYHVGGSIAATFWGVVFKRRFYFIQTSLASGDLERWSPGLILMREHIRRHCENGSEYFDFGPGDGAHKQAWKAESVPLHALFAPRGWRGRLAMLPDRVRAFVKRNPALKKAFTTLRARMRPKTAE